MLTVDCGKGLGPARLHDKASTSISSVLVGWRRNDTRCAEVTQNDVEIALQQGCMAASNVISKSCCAA
jgi:hypothetical protein